MKRILLFFPILLLACFISSCDPDTPSSGTSPDFFLVQAKPGLNAYIDSADLYCDRLLVEYSAGTKKEVLAAAYGPKIKFYENSINQAFDRANILAVQKKLKPGVYERWLDGFNLKQLADKNKRLLSIGIDLASIPAADIVPNTPVAAADTAHNALGQIYADKKNTFTLNLPKDWLANEKEQEGMTIIVAGPANNTAMRNGAIGVNVMDYDKDLSSSDFYYGNIGLIKNNSKDFKLLQETDLDLSGIPAKCAIFSCINNGIPITSIQAYFFQNRKGYILNGTSASDHFNEYQSLYIAIIKSFRMRGNK